MCVYVCVCIHICVSVCSGVSVSVCVCTYVLNIPFHDCSYIHVRASPEVSNHLPIEV